jgi:hypothetical protein
VPYAIDLKNCGLPKLLKIAYLIEIDEIESEMRLNQISTLQWAGDTR